MQIERINNTVESASLAVGGLYFRAGEINSALCLVVLGDDCRKMVVELDTASIFEINPTALWIDVTNLYTLRGVE